MKDKFCRQIQVGDSILFTANWLGQSIIRFGIVKRHVDPFVLEVTKIDFGRQGFDGTAVRIGPVVRLSDPSSIIVINSENTAIDIPVDLEDILTSTDTFSGRDLEMMKIDLTAVLNGIQEEVVRQLPHGLTPELRGLSDGELDCLRVAMGSRYDMSPEYTSVWDKINAEIRQRLDWAVRVE